MNFEQIYYANGQHKEHFLALVNTKMTNESGYYSAYYILTSSKDIWLKVKKYTHLEEIDFEKILEQDFIISHKSLVLLAQHLFMGSASFDLDRDSYSIGLQAIKLRWTLTREGLEYQKV